MSYYISKKLNCSFDQGIERVKKELSVEGFGVVSEIDLQEKLKDKLGVDFRKYRIIGACNPSFAYEALLKEDKIGTMLPCNVIVQEISTHEIEIAAIDPVVSMQGVENMELGGLGLQVKKKLEKVIDNL